jgi:hypothetical protein
VRLELLAPAPAGLPRRLVDDLYAVVMAVIRNVWAVPGGTVWLEFVPDGFRVTHLRPVVKNRLADTEGVALCGAAGGLVTAVVC